MRLNKSTVIFLIYIGISILLRFFSFYPTTLDHDESTYMIIGRDILNGKLLYTDVTDTKPVGIFIIYAFLHAIFGYSIFLKRLFVAVLIGASAHLIYLISKQLFADKKVALWSGAIYILYISIWGYFGLSPNAEVFFNFFTIAGLLFLVQKNGFTYFAGGILFGLGFMVKYLVLLDFVAITLFFFILEIYKTKGFSWRYFSHFALAGLGFILPFVCVNLFFYSGVNFSDFYFITYTIPGSYGNQSELWAYFKIVFDFLLRFFPFSILVFYVLFTKNRALVSWHKKFFLVWIAGVLIAMFLPGKGFSHYSIQLMVPFSFVAGLFFSPELNDRPFVNLILNKKVGLVFLILFISASETASFMENYLQEDKHQLVADYIMEDLSQDDIIYTSNSDQIIYYLTKTESPTKYVHSSILSTDLYKVFGIDNKEEIQRIMDQKPKYVLVKDRFKIVEDLLKEDYFLDRTFQGDKLRLYKRES